MTKVNANSIARRWLQHCCGSALLLLLVSLHPVALTQTSASGFEELKNDAAETQSMGSDGFVYIVGEGYWTAALFLEAEPLPLPVDPQDPQFEDDTSELDNDVVSFTDLAEDVESEPSAAPEEDIEPDVDNFLFYSHEPDYLDEDFATESPESEVHPGDLDLVQPYNFGTLKAHFSSSRLVPRSAAIHYPFSAVGRLFFTLDNGRQASCSAAVIARRIIITAAHCVHSGRTWYRNFSFVPAYGARGNGSAPYQRWTWNRVRVPTGWIQTRGSLPNRTDFALIELSDRRINGLLRRIGDVTGRLGWKTNSLYPNHAHLLGYAANFDRGMQMHRVASESFRKSSNNTVLYGSDMRDGSSGGPWVQNFGVSASGQTGGSNPAMNKVIGVTSYGYTSSGPKVLGSSVLNSTFASLYRGMCSARSGNC